MMTTMLSDLRRALPAMVAAVLALPSAALASAAAVQSAPPTGFVDSVLAWFARAFTVRPITALDWILLVVGPLIGGAIGYFYYRATLLDSVKEMQEPFKVKARCAGLALTIAALVVMLSPHLPVGYLVVLALIGVGLAFSFGLSLLIAAVLAVVIIALIALWVSGLLSGVFG